ncbi:hypothetical protein Leryth_017213 [Lithospermum erythrorhizon]|nr:hypothetical protein Leryth_017213 [Lithospermum erythrorhizon]
MALSIPHLAHVNMTLGEHSKTPKVVLKTCKFTFTRLGKAKQPRNTQRTAANNFFGFLVGLVKAPRIIGIFHNTIIEKRCLCLLFLLLYIALFYSIGPPNSYFEVD